MPGPYTRRKNHSAVKKKKIWSTKRKTKDLDEIDEDLRLIKAGKPVVFKDDYKDLPGEGKFYCTLCAKHFIDQKTLDDHYKTKKHRRQFKELEVEPYSIEESERAASQGSYTKAKKRKLDVPNSTEAPNGTKMEEDRSA